MYLYFVKLIKNNIFKQNALFIYLINKQNKYKKKYIKSLR